MSVALFFDWTDGHRPPLQYLGSATHAVALQLLVLKIRPATDADRDTIWEIFHEIVAAGDTYPIDPEMSREDAFAYWFQTGASAFVAEQDRPASATLRRGKQIVGIYTLHPNQSGGGAHAANAAVMVPASARGKGI